jgi:hypothetical protein
MRIPTLKSEDDGKYEDIPVGTAKEPAGQRWALFAFEHYYPGGGWDDFVRASDDVEYLTREALEWVNSKRHKGDGFWYGMDRSAQIVDLRSLSVAFTITPKKPE